MLYFTGFEFWASGFTGLIGLRCLPRPPALYVEAVSGLGEVGLWGLKYRKQYHLGFT